MSRVRVPSLTPKVSGRFSPLTIFFPVLRCNAIAKLRRRASRTSSALDLCTKAKPWDEFDYYTKVGAV
jgi:hypothetical protein